MDILMTFHTFFVNSCFYCIKLFLSIWCLTCKYKVQELKFRVKECCRLTCKGDGRIKSSLSQCTCTQYCRMLIQPLSFSNCEALIMNYSEVTS